MRLQNGHRAEYRLRHFEAPQIPPCRARMLLSRRHLERALHKLCNCWPWKGQSVVEKRQDFKRMLLFYSAAAPRIPATAKRQDH